MNHAMPFDHEFRREEPLPGYRTTELLGRGGFGEVWKGTAPGGVPKAVKFVFGADDPSRSATELRALNRIKDVRHPLLLSIDRIENVQGTLVIVTELGDKNLKEYFQSCQKEGLPGIPQDVLLRFLRDAADVLDYIYDEYSLQHLDIKPENLLVFGRRLKVADFGLVKNIYERSASLVHGLTPTYAAPEIFEGKPNRNSDQYGLAILYQEMLTGCVPFDGGTAARLAAQHLREMPNLNGLPLEQQPVIARALSKDPSQRYPSCITMVDELEAAARGQAMAPLPSAPIPLKTPPSAVAASKPRRTPTHPPASSPVPAVADPAAAISCADATPSGDEESAALPPTIFVGVGGTAAHVLQFLRQRITDRLGQLRNAKSVRLLLIDSDVDQLNEINRDRDAWEELQTVATPLRTSSEYRERWQDFRSWLSRRWAFNIPRSLRTEGLRPLGRLALVSHAGRVTEAVREVIREASSPENAAQTSQSLGIPFEAGTPRVVLLGSISGGTGGGMLIDLAYALRTELKNAGFGQCQIEGMLMHSTPRGKGRDKAAANAYATLQELLHFSRPGSYFPGDSYLELPPFHGNNRTFSSVQLVQLGENLDEHDWHGAADDAAEYLYCTSFTAARQQSLIIPGVDAGTSLDLGSPEQGNAVELQQLGGCNGAFVHDFARQLCLDLINQWRGVPMEGPSETNVSLSAATLVLDAMSQQKDVKFRDLATEAERKLTESGISLEQIRSLTQEMLIQELGQDERSFLEGLFREAHSETCAAHGNLQDTARISMTMLNQLTGMPSSDHDQHPEGSTLTGLLHARLSSQAMQLSSKLGAWLQGLVNEAKYGVDGSKHAAEAARKRVRELLSTVAREIQLLEETESAHRLQLSPAEIQARLGRRGGLGGLFRPGKPLRQLEQQLVQYGLLRMKGVTLRTVQYQLRLIDTQITSLIDRLMILWQDLKQLSRRLAPPEVEAERLRHGEAQPSTQFERHLRHQLQQHAGKLVHELRQRVETEVFSDSRQLERFLEERVDVTQLVLPLQRSARRLILECMTQILSGSDLMPSEDVEIRRLDVAAALTHTLTAPVKLPRGRDERTLVVVPDSTSPAELEEQFGEFSDDVVIVPANTNSISVCREASGVPLYVMANDIIHGQRIYVELAENLHTRNDIEWQPLDGEEPEREEFAIAEVESETEESPGCNATEPLPCLPM